MNSDYRRPLLLILVIYLLLAIGYGLATPLFEAPDEQHHYFTAAVIASTGRLPTTTDNFNQLTLQEAAQPPLYYLISALIAKPLGVEIDEDMLWPNPAVQLGAADSPQNINAFVHTHEESWPWSDQVLIAHLLRLQSTLIGIGTLLAVFGCAKLVWPSVSERALLATALVAFLPQFAFLHGSISNDPLIIFLCSAAIWQLLRMWYGPLNWQRLVLLGLTIGLAILSKTAGLVLLTYSLGFISLLTWRKQQGYSNGKKLQQMILSILAVTLPALMLGGWLLWRNWQLYGDITAANQFVRLAGGDRGYSLIQVLRETPGLWTSLFAVFGWFNILAPKWVYLIWNGIVGASIVGAIIHVWHGHKATRLEEEERVPSREAAIQAVPLLDWPGMPALLLALWVVLVYAALVIFMLKTPASQGRLLFPAVVPLALGLAFGLSGYRWPGIYLIVPVLALFTSVYCLLFVIPAAYEHPPVIALEGLPVEAQKINVDLGNGIWLLASQMETEQTQAGNWVWLTLYWQGSDMTSDRWKLNAPMYVLELFGQDDALIGKVQSYHGGGLYPASLWSANEILADRVAVEIDQDLIAPIQARLNVKLVGQDPSADVGTVKIVPETWLDPSESVLASINGIDLAEATLRPQVVAPGEAAKVSLRWQVRESPGMALTTFVHLGDPSQSPLAQGDSVPLGGHYPTTLWATGEVFSDTYELTIPPKLPPGLYPVHIGLYNPENGARQVLTVDGVRQPGDAFLVGWLEVKD